MRMLLPVLLLIPSLGLAHSGAGAQGSFAAGAAHPLSGADHVLAMLAVGLWAALLSGRALWLLPAGFVGAMALGFGAATQGVPLPAVEPLILASAPILAPCLEGLSVRETFAAVLAIADRRGTTRRLTRLVNRLTISRKPTPPGIRHAPRA